MMTSSDFDIAIIGAGCIGASIFHALARAGFRDVALVDSGRRSVSATASSGGMLRAFHENPAHVELALASRAAMAALVAADVLPPAPASNGHLYFFDPRRLDSYEPSLALLDAGGHPFELLKPSEGGARFPSFCWDDGRWAVHEPTAGHFDPARFVDALLTASGHCGRIVLDDFEVLRICSHRGRYRLAGDCGSLTARTLILAGGARLLPRLRDLGLELTLEARPITTFSAPASAVSAPNFLDRETLEFGRLAPAAPILLSAPRPARIAAPHWSAPSPGPAAPDCYTPGRAGLLGQVPGHPRLILATGWGGTAFKFALEIGRRVTSIVERESSERSTAYAIH